MMESRAEMAGAYAARLQSSCRTEDFSAVSEVLWEMHAQRLPPPRAICARIIMTCVEKNEMQCACEVLTVMHNLEMKPDPSIYSTLIRNCEKRGFFKEAWRLYEEMASYGLFSNLVTCNALLRAAADLSIDEQKADDLWAKMLDNQVAPDVNSYNALISVCLSRYRSERRVKRAVDLFVELQEMNLRPNVITYMVILGGACEDPIDTSVFKELARRELLPDLATYNELISFCSRGKHPERALSIFQALQVQGVQPDLETYNALLRICKRRGQPERASHIFQLMSQANIEPDSQSYEAIVSACCRRDHVHMALLYFQDMQCKGLTPTLATFSFLLNAFAGNSCSEIKNRLVQSMVGYYSELLDSKLDDFMLKTASSEDMHSEMNTECFNIAKTLASVPPDMVRDKEPLLLGVS